MASFLSLFLLFAWHVVADTILPTDIPSQDDVDQANHLAIQWPPNDVSLMTYNVDPLTSAAGMGVSTNGLKSIFERGVLVIPTDSGNSTTDTQIAFLTCDASNDSNLDPGGIFQIVQSKKPQAILLYSTQENGCNLTETSAYTSVFTMTNVSYSIALLNMLKTSSAASNATIASRAVLQNGSNNATATGSSSAASSTGTGNDGNGDGATPAPTTAVAMSILYSITGIITLLFLIIIATGAVRAHRHPERYGPRNGGFPGRPRQSRAKGLARAMLETLPIVKFGDPDPVKPARDIELESANSNVTHNEPAVAAGGREDGETPRDVNAAEQEGGLGPNQAAPADPHEVSGSGDGDLGCSICTEDFTRGEDVRVLPCNHKYHPACIDPWLLNVSGTCPLCRVDLRPVQTNSSQLHSPTEEFEELPVVAEATETDTAGLENSTGPSHTRRRMSRLLDFNRLRHAEPEERIAALRRLRTEDQMETRSVSDEDDNGTQSHVEMTTTNSNEHGGTNTSSEGREERNRRSRFTRTLRAAFDIRTASHGERATPVAGDTSMVGGRGA